MKITYDPKVDAMYIRFKSGKYDHTKKITDQILADLSKDGKVIGLEILDAKEQFGEIKPTTIEFSSKSSFQGA